MEYRCWKRQRVGRRIRLRKKTRTKIFTLSIQSLRRNRQCIKNWTRWTQLCINLRLVVRKFRRWLPASTTFKRREPPNQTRSSNSNIKCKTGMVRVVQMHPGAQTYESSQASGHTLPSNSEISRRCEGIQMLRCRMTLMKKRTKSKAL